MWFEARKQELLAQTGVRGFGAGDRSIARRELAGSRGIRQTVQGRDQCTALAHALARNGRDRARPLCPRALRDQDFFTVGSGRGFAFNVDGGVDWRTRRIFGRYLGADGDGGDRFVYVAAVV